jgi:hypothetical protein
LPQDRKWLLISALSLTVFGLDPDGCFAEGEKVSCLPQSTAPSRLVLQGGVQTFEHIPAPGFCPAANGFATYQQAWYALGQKQYKLAADNFALAGDQMEAGGGQSRFLAEARFAEAQTRRLMGQYDRAGDLYKRSIAIFEQTDPQSFYLKAARQTLQDLTTTPLKGKVQKNKDFLKAMPLPGIDSVSRQVKLSERVTELDNGVSISTLHNGDFFNRSRGTLAQAAGVDISDSYVKDVVYRAFLKMNCLETSAVGATNYTAPLFYKPILSDGKPVAVGAGSDFLSPVAELKLNGKNYKVPMDLPHISPNSRNVLLVTDDKHVLAIDPRTSEAWKLCASFSKKLPEFNWWKLGRQKGHKFS